MRNSTSMRVAPAIAIAVACISVAGSITSAQQLTDVSLIGNKNWASGSNQGYTMTFEDLNDGDRFTGRWKINAKSGPRVSQGNIPRIDTNWTPYLRGQWNYVVGVFERRIDNTTRYSTWINGVEQDFRTGVTDNMDTFDSVNLNGTALNLDLNLGQDGTGFYNGGLSFKGKVDDVAVWRRAVSASEIASIYSSGINSGLSLSNVVQSTPTIGGSLVGLYNFNGSAADTAGTVTPKNGAWKTNAAGTAEKYTTGLFGQSADFDGRNYVTLGTAGPNGTAFPDEYKFGTTSSFTFGAWIFEEVPALPADANFLGTGVNRLSSNPINWTRAPSDWDDTVTVTFATGTSAINPAVIDTALGSKIIKTLVIGAASVPPAAATSTFVAVQPGASLVALGFEPSTIGPANSNVTLNMTGGTLSHWGPSEERSSLNIAEEGATVNITMSGSSMISSGNLLPDAAYATGFRRSNLNGSEGARNGDDLTIGRGTNSTTTVTLGDNAKILAFDVLYSGDNTGASVNVTQNGNSLVAANWDSRLLDNPSLPTQSVNWTLNNTSKFLAARDHGLGEVAGEGTINLTVNNTAEVAAGDRVFIGAGGVGTTVNVVLNGGTLRAGETTANNLKLVDETGGPSVPAVDYILVMGTGANANLNVNGGGNVLVGRNAYVGFNGGNSVVNLNDGTMQIFGVGAAGVARLGNAPDTLPFPFLGAATPDVPWADAGGDLFLSIGGTPERSAPNSSVNVSGTSRLLVARDVQVGGTYYAGQLGTPAPGISQAKLNVKGPNATVTIGGDLVFGGVRLGDNTIVGGNTNAVLGAKLTAPTHSLINVNGTAGGRTGSVFIFNDPSQNVTSMIDATIETPYAIYRPTTGTSIPLVKYTGSLTGQFGGVTGSEVDGIDWTVQYDNSGKQINLVASKVYRLGNATRKASDEVDLSDFGALAANFGDTGDKIWAQGDFTNEGNVDLADFGILAANFGVAPSVTGRGPVGTLELLVDPADGSVRLDGNAVNFNGYQIRSAGLSLVPANLVTVTFFGQIFDPNGLGFLSRLPGNIAAGSPTANVPLDSTVLLGNIFSLTGTRDLTFTYTKPGNANLFTGSVIYIPEPGVLGLLVPASLALSRRRRA